MHDKLVKTGHRRFYYGTRRFFGFVFAGLLGFFIASLPLAITHQRTLEAKAQQDDTSEVVSSSSESSTETSETPAFESFEPILDFPFERP